MNDEDFARQAFAAAFRSGHTGEPPTLPDVELLALHGQRANRNRHGLYAAGTTALAGVVVAGVVTGPSLLGLGSDSPSGIGTAAAGSTPPASPAPSRSSSAPDPAKPSPGVTCATPPAINWASVVAAALPALRCRGHAVLASQVFAPLGWHVEGLERFDDLIGKPWPADAARRDVDRYREVLVPDPLEVANLAQCRA